MGAPHAPWKLLGDCVAGLARRPRGGTRPDGLQPLFGPAVVIAARYQESPIGGYSEMVFAEPARLGLRPGLCATTVVVDSAEARVGGRLNWGYPKELGTLLWEREGEERSLRWVERGIVVRGRPAGPVMPLFIPFRNVQRRGDGPVVVPASVRGRGHLARVEVELGDNDPLVWLAGSHRGLVVDGLHYTLDPARLPTGLTSTLRAPLTAPEPAMSSAES
ncbi:MAG: acetoacetate decarboxylase family protein [Acidimicrobiia bacterium]|nr:acetoacetate decarboxylase family protein [Acidimicrobiia bacterium]